jgi:hypothetical protein
MSAITNGAPPSEALASLRERVQARREALQAQQSITLDVPGYNGELRARYRLIDFREARRINERIDTLRDLDSATRELYIAADTLVIACEAVLDAEGHEFDPWSPELAHSLGFPDPQTARQAVFAVIFRDHWVIQHAIEFETWVAGEVQAVTEELAGESAPPTPSS